MTLESSIDPGRTAPPQPSPAGTPSPAVTATETLDIETSIEKFAAAISTNLGAEADSIITGDIHRFDDPEKNTGNKNCWCYLDETGTYGMYGNWGTDERYDWYLDDFEAISDDERARIQAKVEAAKQQRKLERRNNHEEAAKKAAYLFNSAQPAEQSHPYLQRKFIPPTNARQMDDRLFIPLVNAASELRNVQTIGPSGKKRFQKNGEVSGNFSLIGMDELPAQGSIIVCEGWATGISLHQERGWPVAAAMNAGNLDSVCTALREVLPDEVTIVIAADDDRHTSGNPGLAKALAASDAIGAQVIQPEFPCIDCKCTDFNDVAICQQRKADQADSPDDKTKPSNPAPAKDQPIPLTSTLPPVKPLVEEMLPNSIGGFVTDVSTRLQIPADYIAVCVIGVIAGVVGAKCRIHPKQNDDWLVVATMWISLIGPPSAMKSACMSAAQGPLQELEKDLTAAYTEALEIHQIDTELSATNLKEIKKKAAESYSDDRETAIQAIRDAAFKSPEPTRHRYVINDATIEKLGELMQENPNGLLLIRDELSGWLANMIKEDYQGDRAFYLECFEGNSPLTWDRIGRGTIVIEQCVLSIIGGIQPSKITPVIREAIHGTMDDGLIQRFQLAVWPDVKKDWKWIDRAPDAAATAAYKKVLNELHELPGADSDEPGKQLRFSEPAQVLYIAWMEQIQTEIRDDNVQPVMQSHLAKMPKTIAGLALLFELIDGGRTEVGEQAIAKAILWADYLKSHAERLYSLASSQGVTGAKLILSRRGKLPDIFTARELKRKNWTGLSTKAAIEDALECLVEHRQVTELPVSTTGSGGRPTMRYRWHPSITVKS